MLLLFNKLHLTTDHETGESILILVMSISKSLQEKKYV